MILITTLLSFINPSGQCDIIWKGKLHKMTIAEKITEQTITKATDSGWVFTSCNVYMDINNKLTVYNVETFKYDSANYYIFLCKDASGREFSIQYKNTVPEHVMIVSMDGTGQSFICHN